MSLSFLQMKDGNCTSPRATFLKGCHKTMIVYVTTRDGKVNQFIFSNGINEPVFMWSSWIYDCFAFVYTFLWPITEVQKKRINIKRELKANCKKWFMERRSISLIPKYVWPHAPHKGTISMCRTGLWKYISVNLGFIHPKLLHIILLRLMIWFAESRLICSNLMLPLVWVLHILFISYIKIW